MEILDDPWYIKLQEEKCHLESRLAAAEQRNAELVDLLCEIEWIEHNGAYRYCPRCHWLQEDGHWDGCPLGAALTGNDNEGNDMANEYVEGYADGFKAGFEEHSNISRARMSIAEARIIELSDKIEGLQEVMACRRRALWRMIL